MSDTEKRLEKALISAVEKWAEEGCATPKGWRPLRQSHRCWLICVAISFRI